MEQRQHKWQKGDLKVIKMQWKWVNLWVKSEKRKKKRGQNSNQKAIKK